MKGTDRLLDLDSFQAGWLLRMSARKVAQRARAGLVPGAWRDPAPDGTPDAVGEWRFDVGRFGSGLATAEQQLLLEQLACGEIRVRRPEGPHARPRELDEFEVVA